jgi:hypothetical protein
MYRYRIGISFVACFFAPFILGMDLPYGDFDGLTVAEAIHYFAPCADGYSDSSNMSDDDGYAWNHDAYANNSYPDSCANNYQANNFFINNDEYVSEQEVNAQNDSHNTTSCLNENDFDEEDFPWFVDETDEEPCSPYMHNDGDNDGKNDRREKRVRDMKKDRPYRIEYIESIRNLDGALLTRQAKRQFYDDARANYLTNKLSIKKGANLGFEKTYHRRQNKIQSAFRRMNIAHQKENTKNNSDSKIFPLAKDALTSKRKYLDKSNIWQKNGPEVIVDKRCQNLEKIAQIRRGPHKTKIITQKKPRKNFPVKHPEQFDPINCPSRQQESLKFSPPQKILRPTPPVEQSCHSPIYFWTSSTMPYFGG